MDQIQAAMIDIEKLAISLHEELESLYPLSDQYNSIYRVPKRLRELNEKAYTPQVVSIGPLHYGTDKLIPMEEHKRRYLQDFLRRAEANNIVDYVGIIKSNEVKLRNSYAEDIKLSSDEFVKMILVDAAFIIEILLKSMFRNLQNQNDRIFTKPWMIADIMFDLCLLENQLPFFILKELGAYILMAGVKFKKVPNKSLFEMKFDGGSGVLEIPHLKINDFVVLINHLVNTPKDVDLLIQFGIIENWLPESVGVSTLFHNLVKETSIIPDNFYFSVLVDDMKSYCRTPWHRWKATLKQDYFRNPWTGISVFAAIVLLRLTFVQTVYSVLKI
ncbi:hypothetical protein EZV62_001797 [Acer yangbiense]|uniref:Uncharacterized protein n=1 Tax=Acer yangbiense TaxID=1000413 RepID=A0A5C7IVW1_9ROSI|nr:hypothetical protein EZV62_001797 [Acer yangbiense]